MSKTKDIGETIKCNCTHTEDEVETDDNDKIIRKEAVIQNYGIPLLMAYGSSKKADAKDIVMGRRIRSGATCLPIEYIKRIRRRGNKSGLFASAKWSKDGDYIIISPYLTEYNSIGDQKEVGDDPTKEFSPLEKFRWQDTVFLFDPKDRQTLKLRFTEWSVGTATIPIRYREVSKKWIQRRQNDSLSTAVNQFSTGLSLGGIATYSIGNTKFKRRISGNVTRNMKHSFGASLDFEGISFKYLEQSIKDNENTEVEIKTIAFSPGIVYMAGIDNVQISLSAGYSFSFERSQDWAHHKQLYIGLGAGFGLFKLGGV